MRKTLIYLIILGVLGFGVYYFLFNQKQGIFSSKEAGFQVKDTAAIGKIFLSGPTGESVLVERTDSGWIVNKHYKALPSTLRVLLKTLTKQAPLYPVPESARNNVVSTLAGNSVKVELYDRSGQKMRVFYVGGEAYDFKGTYMLMDGAKNPYVIQVPNFQGYITPSYPYNLEAWRDRTIFDLAPGEIKSVSVQYPATPVNSFVETQGSDSSVAVTTAPAVMSNNKFNERRARVYLKFFQNINCEGYVKNNHFIDSIIGVVPKYCVIDLNGTHGQHQHLEVYWMPINRRSKNIQAPSAIEPNGNKYDADRFYAIMNNFQDTIIIQSYVFDKIFRKGYEFYQPDEQAPPPPPDETKNPHKHLPMPVPPQNISAQPAKS